MQYRSTKEAPEKLRPYIFHGVDINTDADVATGKCPFCQADKFGVKTETGQFNCFVCHNSGNVYTFLKLLWEQASEQTDTDMLTNLANKRRLSVEGLHRFGLAINPLTDEWIVPGYNTKGAINTLFRVVPVGRAALNAPQKYQLLATPTLKFGMFKPYKIELERTTVLEGLWDAVALSDYFEENPDEATGILPCPGSGNFQADWFDVLDGKEVDLAFDNDHPKRHKETGEVMKVKGQFIRPGWDGMNRIIKLLGERPANKTRPKSIRRLHWNLWSHAHLNTEAGPEHGAAQPGHHPDLPDGFDIRDLVRSGGFNLLAGLYVPVTISPPKKKGEPEKEAPKVTPIPCTTFTELCTYFDQNLHFTQQLKDTLAVMLAVVFSTKLPEEQLWMRILGPPGSGKTTLAEAISAAREYVKPLSMMTGFHSGFVEYDERGKRHADASPLLKLLNMCLITKDGDTLINSPNRDRMLAEARDLFDGQSRTQYRNKAGGDMEGIRMTWMLCGTNSMRALNRTFLGERFLDCEIFSRDDDATPFVRRAIHNTYASLAGAMAKPIEGGDDDHIKPDRLLILKQATYGFLKHLYTTQHAVPEFTPENELMVETLGKYLGYMRAKVERDKEELSYRPEVELPTRLGSQVTKLAFCLAIILGRPSVDEEVIRVIYKVVHDSAKGFSQEVTKVIADAQRNGGISVQRISQTLNLGETSVRRILQDLQEFQVVQRRAKHNNSGQRGRDVHLWELSPFMRELWDIVFPPELTNENGDHLRRTSASQNANGSVDATGKVRSSGGHSRQANKSQNHSDNHGGTDGNGPTVSAAQVKSALAKLRARAAAQKRQAQATGHSSTGRQGRSASVSKRPKAKRSKR